MPALPPCHSCPCKLLQRPPDLPTQIATCCLPPARPASPARRPHLPSQGVECVGCVPPARPKRRQQEPHPLAQPAVVEHLRGGQERRASSESLWKHQLATLAQHQPSNVGHTPDVARVHSHYPAQCKAHRTLRRLSCSAAGSTLHSACTLSLPPRTSPDNCSSTLVPSLMPAACSAALDSAVASSCGGRQDARWMVGMGGPEGQGEQQAASAQTWCSTARQSPTASARRVPGLPAAPAPTSGRRPAAPCPTAGAAHAAAGCRRRR